MKLKNVLFAGALALTLGACSSTPAASSTPTSSASSAKEEVATEGHYTVSNVSGKTITELYFYKTGSEEKGENWAGEGLAADASVEVNVEVEKEAAIAGYAMTVEYVGEDGTSVVVFDNLHLEEANMFLKPAADVEGGATPFLAAE